MTKKAKGSIEDFKVEVNVNEELPSYRRKNKTLGRMIIQHEGTNRSQRRAKKYPKLRLTKKLKMIRGKSVIGGDDVSPYKKLGISANEYVKLSTIRMIQTMEKLNSTKTK